MPSPERYMLGPRAARFLQDEMKAKGLEGDQDFLRPLRTFVRPSVAHYPEVRVTSLTLVSGRYPGKVLSFDANTNTYTDFADCWIVELNGGALAVQRYQATRKDEQNGRLVFVVDKGSGTGGGATPGGPTNAIQSNQGTFYGDAQLLYVPGAYGTTPYQAVVYHASTAGNTGGNLVLSPTYYFARTLAAAHGLSLGRVVYAAALVGTPTVFVDVDCQTMLGGLGFYGEYIINCRNDGGAIRVGILRVNGQNANGSFGVFGQCVGQQAAIAAVAGTAGAAYGATEQTMLNDLKAALNAWLAAARTSSGGYGFIP